MRLYLDTADILDIADGRRDPEGVAELRAAVSETKTIVILSKDHFWDILPRCDEASIERVITALEGFPYVAIPLEEPHELEKISKTADVQLASPTSIRAFFIDPQTRKMASVLSTTAGFLHDAEEARRSAAIADGPRKLSNKDQERLLQYAISLMRGVNGRTAEDTADFWDRHLDMLEPEKRAAFMAVLIGKILASLRRR